MRCISENLSHRRSRPRVPVHAFCSEHDDYSERHATIVDLSEHGLRVQRPAGGFSRRQALQLEFEIPEVDEIVWATGRICFDEIWRVPAKHPGGLAGVLRTSGVRLVAAAERHKRMLREYVTETWRRRQRAAPDLVEPNALALTRRYLRA